MSRRTGAAAGAAALLVVAAVVAAATSHERGRPSTLPAPAGPWHDAVAAVLRPDGRRGACGIAITSGTAGIRDPLLPCGVKLYLEAGGATVLAEVVDRGPVPVGTDIAVTPALARLLGMGGRASIRWRFVR